MNNCFIEKEYLEKRIFLRVYNAPLYLDELRQLVLELQLAIDAITHEENKERERELAAIRKGV